MKKLFVLILVLILSTTAWADTSPRLDSLRLLAFEQSLVPATGNLQIDTVYGRRIINRAIQQVCYDFPAIERYDTIASISGTRLYAINNDFLRLKTVLKYTTSDDLKNLYALSFPPIESWFEAKGGEAGGKPDPAVKPDPRYAWVFADKLYLYPTPSRADTFIVAYYAIDTLLNTPTSSTTSVLPEFREAIIWYAASLICARKGDFQRAQLYRQYYNEKLQVSTQIREPEKKQ